MLRGNIKVVPYIGTWIETRPEQLSMERQSVVPYIGTWIETLRGSDNAEAAMSYLI